MRGMQSMRVPIVSSLYLMKAVPIGLEVPGAQREGTWWLGMVLFAFSDHATPLLNV